MAWALAVGAAGCVGGGAYRAAPMETPSLARAARPVRVALERVEVRGADAAHAGELAASLADATAARLAEAGLTVAAGPGTAAELLGAIVLDVDFYYPDILQVEVTLKIRRGDEVIGGHQIPRAQVTTPSFVGAAATQLANAFVSAAGKASPQEPSPEPPSQTKPPAPANAPIVAIFDVEDLTRKVAAPARAQLTEYLTATAARTLGWRVVPRAQLKAELESEKAKSLSACVDEACQIELGKAVAAQQALATKILEVGKQCAVTSTLYDLKTEAVIAAASVKVACSTNDLLGSLDEVVQQLERRR